MIRHNVFLFSILKKSTCSYCNGLMKTSHVLFSTKESMKSNPKNSTIDQGEVDRHSKLSKTWWDPNGSMKALHAYNHLRVPFVRDGLVDSCGNQKSSTPLLGKKILDVGCGGGILSEPLARLGAQVTGLEPSQELVQLATDHSKMDDRLKDNLPKYISSSIEEHAKEHSEYYDGVVASEVIEHVENKELFVKSCVQVLKPGGRIFFTTPMKSRISQFAGIYMAEYVLRIVPVGTHDYEKFITPNELSFLLDRSNCCVEKIHGAFYNFITNRWSFIDSNQFIFFLQAVKI